MFHERVLLPAEEVDGTFPALGHGVRVCLHPGLVQAIWPSDHIAVKSAKFFKTLF